MLSHDTARMAHGSRLEADHTDKQHRLTTRGLMIYDDLCEQLPEGTRTPVPVDGEQATVVQGKSNINRQVQVHVGFPLFL